MSLIPSSIDSDFFRRRDLAAPAADFGRSSPDYYPTLRTHWRALINRRWTILTITLVLVAFAAIVSFKMRPVYRATSKIEIESEAPPLQSLADLYRLLPSDEAFLQTQVDVLESDSLAWKTIEQLRLGARPEFAGNDGVLSSVHGNSLLATRTHLLQRYRSRLQVNLLNNSRMVEVSFESTRPEMAAQVANAMVDNYMQYNFRKKYDATRLASQWMEQQLDELKARVEESQQALVDYERRNAIVSINDKQSIAEQKLADLDRELTQAQSDRMKKEARYEMARSSNPPALDATQDELLGRLLEKSANLRAQYVEALDKYGPRFPRVTQLRDQINEIQGYIDRERSRLAEVVHDDYQAALAREKLLADATRLQKDEVGKFNQLLIQHNLLKREFETNQQLYDSLLQHLKDATVSAGLKATNIHVVDAAVPPTVPVRPKILLNIAIALAAGLFLGVVLAFTREALDNSISGVEDLEDLVSAPALAVVPVARKAGPHARLPLRRGTREEASNHSAVFAVLNTPDSPLAESYRKLCTSILLSTAPRPPQAILITSTQAFEGKTCTSVNLALTLAQRNLRTLIIDGDLRKQGVCRAFGSTGALGLTGILTGAHGIDEALQQVEMLPGLALLPTGPRPPNPAELLSSSAMEKVLSELRRRFDHLVIDSPPLLPVTDATVLSTLVDGVVLVVESGVTDRGALSLVQRTLENAGSKILGTVLNKFEPSRDGYYGYSYHAYFNSYPKEGQAGGNSKTRVQVHTDLQPPA